jgi:predicted regulator of Ras-like GTPase activity (Roadblock/LC7/MglB family)
MASSNDSAPRRSPDAGGDIVGLGLADVIQINHQNRFSGCIAVESTVGAGLLFFRDGEIIHAEQGSRTGEAAFYDMLEWPRGKLRLQPNVATTRSTIQKGSQHLLLEASRVLDERRAGRNPAAAAASAPRDGAPRAPLRSSDVLEKLRGIPGITYAALHGKDGAQVGDDSYQAEVLAGQAMFLSMLGEQLGSVFQAGSILSASVHGTSHHLLLFATKSHFLSILVRGDCQAGAVEAEVRKVLAPAR